MLPIIHNTDKGTPTQDLNLRVVLCLVSRPSAIILDDSYVKSIGTPAEQKVAQAARNQQDRQNQSVQNHMLVPQCYDC